MTYPETYNWLKTFYRPLPLMGMLVMLIIVLIKKHLGGEFAKARSS